MDIWQALGLGFQDAASAVTDGLSEIVPFLLILIGGSIALETAFYFLFAKVFHSRHALPYALWCLWCWAY